MKKIVLLISCMLFSLNVYATTEYKDVNYLITINNSVYTVNVKFNKNDSNSDEYMIDYNSLMLSDEKGNSYYYGNQIGLLTNPNFCSDYFYTYPCQNQKTVFSLEEIESRDFLPSFINYNGGFLSFGEYDFLFFISSDNSFEKEDKEDLIEIFKKVNGVEIDINNFQSSSKINSTTDIEYNTNYFDVKNLPSEVYINKAKSLKNLIDKVNDVKVCTEVDLNKLKKLKDVPLLDIEDEMGNLTLSNSCYDVIFGDGIGDNNSLYSLIIDGYTYMSKVVFNSEESDIYTMAYLYYESYYLESVGILEGSLMQKEIVPVVQCNWLGDKTTEIIQYAFDVLKFAGIVIGTLLAIVDIFKAIVQKDKDSNKQLGTLMKRIIAIVALILTPILVDIIFEFINTVGIDNPICGIR